MDPWTEETREALEGADRLEASLVELVVALCELALRRRPKGGFPPILVGAIDRTPKPTRWLGEISGPSWKVVPPPVIS